MTDLFFGGPNNPLLTTPLTVVPQVHYTNDLEYCVSEIGVHFILDQPGISIGSPQVSATGEFGTTSAQPARQWIS